jgi:hypothetical protein
VQAFDDGPVQVMPAARMVSTVGRMMRISSSPKSPFSPPWASVAELPFLGSIYKL